MSEQEAVVLEDLHSAVAQWGTVIKAMRILIFGAFGIGVWVTTLEWRTRALERDSTSGREVLAKIDSWKSKVEGTRWTIQDHTEWAAAEMQREADRLAALRDQNNLQELRLQRLEDQQAVIEKEIADKLKVTPAMVLEEVKRITDKLTPR